MEVDVYYLSLKPETPCNDYWDYGFVNDFIKGEMWRPANFPEFKLHEVGILPKDDRAIVLLPARHHAGLETRVNAELSKIKHVVLFLMGDEEADFKVEEIKHPSIHIWVQNPHPGRHDAYNKLGTGYPPQLREHVTADVPNKDLDVYFSGQITHKRREEMWDVLIYYQEQNRDKQVRLVRTRGFTQGVPHSEYYGDMKRAKICPAPAGAVIPDSFRLYEALECMAIPVADEKNSSGSIKRYWDWLFGEETGFPKIQEWDRLYGFMDEILEDWPGNMHRQTAWWIAKKREFAYKICEQLGVEG